MQLLKKDGVELTSSLDEIEIRCSTLSERKMTVFVIVYSRDIVGRATNANYELSKHAVFFLAG